MMRNKLFPVAGRNTEFCRPNGICPVCRYPFVEIEPVYWIMKKGQRKKEYYHARCAKDPFCLSEV